MKALFVKIEDDLNKRFEKHINEYNLKKAHVIRDSLNGWLTENEDDSTREGSGMEDNVSTSELGTQQAT